MDERVPIGWFPSRLPYVPTVGRNCETPENTVPGNGGPHPPARRWQGRARQLRDGHGGVGLVGIIAQYTRAIATAIASSESSLLRIYAYNLAYTFDQSLVSHSNFLIPAPTKQNFTPLSKLPRRRQAADYRHPHSITSSAPPRICLSLHSTAANLPSFLS